MSDASTSQAGSKGSGRAAYGGPKIKKIKAAVPASEKQKAGKALDLSLKSTKEPLEALPESFKDGSALEELRRLDLSGQTRIFRDVGLSQLRFAGGTLTWLNLSGVDCNMDPSDQTRPGGGWTFLRMMQTLFVLTLSNCNLVALPKEIASVTSLKALVASHNSLTSPSLEHLAPLEHLNSLILGDNQLVEFPTSTLSRLKSLKKLSLANNNIDSKGVPSFAALNTVLEEVRLNGNPNIQAAPRFRASDSDNVSLSLLELSYTAVARIADLSSLKDLPKLVNLGLRGTPISEHVDYKSEITGILPHLRILDNVRFDPLYLARKAKSKEADHSHSSRQAKGSVDQGWQKNSASVQGEQRKRKAPNESEDLKSEKRVSSTRSSRQHRSTTDVRHDDTGDDDTQEGAPAERPKKRRAHNRQEKRKQEHLEPAAAQRKVKDPKTIGGSLSDPKPDPSSAAAPAAEADLAMLAKSRSSVAGIVEVVASSKRAKERPSQRGKANRGGKKDASEDVDESAVKQADVLAALEQERAKASFQSGWD